MAAIYAERSEAFRVGDDKFLGFKGGAIYEPLAGLVGWRGHLPLPMVMLRPGADLWLG